MFTILIILQIVIAIALIVIVMIQQGKGAEAGAALSSGSQSLLGTATGGNTMTRITTVLAIIFIVNSLVMAAITPSGERNEEGSVILTDTPEINESNDNDVPNIPLPNN